MCAHHVSRFGQVACTGVLGESRHQGPSTTTIPCFGAEQLVPGSECWFIYCLITKANLTVLDLASPEPLLASKVAGMADHGGFKFIAYVLTILWHIHSSLINMRCLHIFKVCKTIIVVHICNGQLKICGPFIFSIVNCICEQQLFCDMIQSYIHARSVLPIVYICTLGACQQISADACSERMGRRTLRAYGPASRSKCVGRGSRFKCTGQWVFILAHGLVCISIFGCSPQIDQNSSADYTL